MARADCRITKPPGHPVPGVATLGRHTTGQMSRGPHLSARCPGRPLPWGQGGHLSRHGGASLGPRARGGRVRKENRLPRHLTDLDGRLGGGRGPGEHSGVFVAACLISRTNAVHPWEPGQPPLGRVRPHWAHTRAQKSGVRGPSGAMLVPRLASLFREQSACCFCTLCTPRPLFWSSLQPALCAPAASLPSPAQDIEGDLAERLPQWSAARRRIEGG